MTQLTHIQPADLGEADQALKTKHRAVWASGNYASVVNDIVHELGPILVEAAGIKPGDLVLDVAAGTGNAAIPAAQTGAQVIASDLTPELMEVGKRWAAEVGVELTWETADAEALPYGDGVFDAVLSCLGVMFAPHHQPAADELVRVCRPGGTIGLIAWTPAGFIGQMFATMKPYAPPPPPGAQPPPLWGDEDHVRELLGDRVEQVQTKTRAVRVSYFATPEAFRDYFKANYGPTISIYKAIADDPERVAALDRDLVEMARRFDVGTDSTVVDWEYLLLTARRSS
ncbi:MAG TPA: class I SAM-dependent methyltransferase [Propionibacteriaceae bacterium]|nr:class I SAM-dependent methyltransferase [Propionibacteriaceae bacterium]